MSEIIRFTSVDNIMDMIVPDKMYSLIKSHMKDVVFKFHKGIGIDKTDVDCLYYDEAISLTQEQIEYLSSIIPKGGHNV